MVGVEKLIWLWIVSAATAAAGSAAMLPKELGGLFLSVAHLWGSFSLAAAAIASSFASAARHPRTTAGVVMCRGRASILGARQRFLTRA